MSKKPQTKRQSLRKQIKQQESAIDILCKPLKDRLLDLSEGEEWLCRECRQRYGKQSGFEGKFEIQSGNGSTDDNNIVKISNRAVYENVKFADQHDPYLYDVDSTTDPTRRLQDTDDAALEHFFSRPLKIAEEEWATSTTLGFDINPWSLYWENPRVINRIANYKLLRANMMVKVVINGNGFQYGRAMMSYLPVASFDSLSSNASLIREDLVQASQQPRIFLDPTTSTGGEMKLPFFNFHNYTDIVSTQWSQLGQLYFRSLNELKHANGATDKVTISVFAWATDVSMNVLTSNDPDQLVPQSGRESGGEIEEANMKGMISGPATKVAKASSALSGIPYIGPFASATSVAAGATAEIAKMFGYCRPSVTKNPEPYRPTPMSSLSVCNVPDTAQKLTVDEKQELTIDPRTTGLGGVDPMNIKEIAKRESYITTFSWDIGAAPETLLWNSRVDPVIWAENSGPPTSYHFPACAMAAFPFQYWTGTMKFRFQIVASSFHKGRLKFVYDPEFLASNEYNTNYMKIVDIAEEQDFTLEIGNGQDVTLLSHHRPGLDSVTQMYGTTAFASKGEGNGVVGVYVVNELTTPNSTVNNDIEINVFVSMGDDFEVFAPDDYFMNFTFGPTPQAGGNKDFSTQSGTEIVPDGQNTSEPSAPQQEEAEQLGPAKQNTGLINQVFTGEAITSFRTMLKRYNLHSSIGPLDSTPTLAYGRRPHFPLYRGGVSGAVDTTATAAPYNYCNTVLLHWVATAFSGRRGGIRYKLIPRGATNSYNKSSVQRVPHIPSTPNYQEGTLPMPTYSSSKAVHASVVREEGLTPVPSKPLAAANGMALTISLVNSVLEFESPYYSAFRFTPGKSADESSFQFAEAAWDYHLEFFGSDTQAMDVYVAAAEDFQTFFWTGLPRMYYEASPPI